MHNWSTNENAFDKNSEEYKIWRMEQLINFGLGDEKLSIADLRKYWSRLHIDPARRKFLHLLLRDGNSY